MTKELVIVRPDDWHLHLRDEDFLPITVNESAKSFARAIIMPNLVPPITKLVDAENYKRRILSALKPNLSFDPLMTLYLTEETDPKEVKEGAMQVEEIDDVDLQLVWDPPWTKDMMSDAAKLELNL